jgi:fatty acid synthase
VQEKAKSGERSVGITLDDMDLKYLSGHIIDGRNLFPAMGYLVSWRIYSLLQMLQKVFRCW